MQPVVTIVVAIISGKYIIINKVIRKIIIMHFRDVGIRRSPDRDDRINYSSGSRRCRIYINRFRRRRWYRSINDRAWVRGCYKNGAASI